MQAVPGQYPFCSGVAAEPGVTRDRSASQSFGVQHLVCGPVGERGVRAVISNPPTCREIAATRLPSPGPRREKVLTVSDRPDFSMHDLPGQSAWPNLSHPFEKSAGSAIDELILAA